MDVEIDLSGLDDDEVSIDVGALSDYVITIAGLRLTLHPEQFDRLCAEIRVWNEPLEENEEQTK